MKCPNPKCGVTHDPTLGQRGCHPITHAGAMCLVNSIREFLLGAVRVAVAIDRR